MPINTDLADPIGQIRVLIADDQDGDGVLPLDANISDDLLTYFYTEEGESVGRAGARAAEYTADKWRSVPAEWQIANESEVITAVTHWQQRARQLRDTYGSLIPPSSTLQSLSGTVRIIPFGGS